MKPTLTYPLSNKQVIFDYVWHHFITENNPFGVGPLLRSNSLPPCIYNTPTGGCSIGCLLPADLRSKLSNATSIGIKHMIPHFPGVFEASDDMLGFLIGLQEVHDNNTDCRPEFKLAMETFATKHNLTVSQKVTEIANTK